MVTSVHIPKERLSIRSENWVEFVESFHAQSGLVVGCARAVAAAAEQAGRHWFRDGKFCDVASIT